MSLYPGVTYILLPRDAEGQPRLDLRERIEIANRPVRSVGIQYLSEVVDHRIAVIVDSVSHYVRFHNGGELCYAFNGRGEVIELSGRAVCFAASAEGDYTFWALDEPRPVQ